MENKYKITKSKDPFQARYDIYDIEKTIIYDNGKTEKRYKTWIPSRDGDINKIDFDTLDFPKPITHEEWKQLSPEYRKAWCNGTMTKELNKELENLRSKVGE